jgi:hypothetical protein
MDDFWSKIYYTLTYDKLMKSIPYFCYKLHPIFLNNITEISTRTIFKACGMMIIYVTNCMEQGSFWEANSYSGS